MARYVLGGNGTGRRSVVVEAAPMTVTVTVTGGAGAVAGAWRAGRPDPDALCHTPTLLLLPHVADTSLVRVVPAGTRSFPDGATLTVVLRTERPGGGDDITRGPLPVGGLGIRDVVEITAEGGTLRVSACESAAEEALGPLATEVRARVRQTLGVDRLDPVRRIGIGLVVDVSASMTAALRDGSVRAVVDVIAGLATVVGRDVHVPACLLTDPPVWLPAGVPPGDLAAAVVAGIDRCGLGVGFRLPVDVLDADVVLVVTDAVPPAPVTDPGCRLVLTGAPATPGGRPVALAPPPPGVGATEHLLGPSRALSELVAALVADLLPTPIPPAVPEGADR